MRAQVMTAYAGRFSGKVALVAAAGHGIGRAVAVRLAREGARVAAVDIRVDLVAETHEQLRVDSPDSAFWLADLADSD
jgi:NAD(P)-dependent dehydrogenase (short-subunit alcohol dehydrogenase family)